MSIGPLLRRWLPASLELSAANLYRAVFVDLNKVAWIIAKQLPAGARVLDIGGCDGELLNRLFALRPDRFGASALARKRLRGSRTFDWDRPNYLVRIGVKGAADA